MGIGVKKAVLDNLLDVIVGELDADFPGIVARFLQSLKIVDGQPADIFHHQHPGGGIPVFDRRAGNVNRLAVVGGEFFHVPRLDEKIHFLLRGKPHFVEHGMEIDHIARAAGQL